MYVKWDSYYYIIDGRFFLSSCFIFILFLFRACIYISGYFFLFLSLSLYLTACSIFFSGPQHEFMRIFIAVANKLMVCILISMPIDWKLINFLIFNRKFVFQILLIHTSYHSVPLCCIANSSLSLSSCTEKWSHFGPLIVYK